MCPNYFVSFITSFFTFSENTQAPQHSAELQYSTANEGEVVVAYNEETF